MRILYAIQGTGNGHMARAEEIVPHLLEFGKVDLFVSGSQADIKLPYPVKYKSKGLSFYFGKSGGIDFLKTFKFNSSKRVLREIRELPVTDYDLVVNDFEAISAYACRKRKVPCLALSHQFAMLSPKIPKPRRKDPVGAWFLKHYAPVPDGVGFHFAPYDRKIFSPVIRSSLKDLKVSDKGHYTVYLPAYDDERLVAFLQQFRNVRWQVFSKHCTGSYVTKHVSVRPVDNQAFLRSMVTSSGVLCGAGFETPSEAISLGKKLMVVPMKNQYEQHLNAAALKSLGVPVCRKIGKKAEEKLAKWLEEDRFPKIEFADVARPAVEQIMKLYHDGSGV